MFVLDKLIFDFIYGHCKVLGSTFGLGAMEGFILYAGTITAGITAILNKREKK